MAIDPESRLIVSLVVGKRTAESTHALVQDFRARTGGRVMRLMTSDEHAPYEEAIRAAYGRVVEPPRTGRRGVLGSRMLRFHRRSHMQLCIKSGRTIEWFE